MTYNNNYLTISVEDADLQKVLVFNKSKKSRQQKANETRIANRVRAYERQIESLKRNLLKIEKNSRRGRSYKRRIMVLEKRIERLKGQYN
jgi:hypothetical protein